MKENSRLKKVDLNLFLHFLQAMSEINPIGITALQRKTGTNTTSCRRYLTLIEKLELAKSIVKGKRKDVPITERGREALRLLSNYLE